MNIKTRTISLLAKHYYSIVERLNKKNIGYAVICENESEELDIFKIYKTYNGAKNFVEKIVDEKKFYIIEFNKTELYATFWALEN